MLTTDIKRKIDSARDILVGKVPDPKAQVDQITNALIYKFMDDMDQESVDMGGKPQFFNNGYEKYSWSKLMDPKLGGLERLDLYVESITKLSQNPHIPQLFRDIFKDAYLPYRDPETLSLFLKQINEFTYHHSEELGNSFEYLLSVLGSQGDAGQFRTPRHVIDFIVAVVDPKKTDRILDPACGTAGFLISAYKHIMASHDGKDESGKPNEETRLSPDERKRLVKSVVGYDISPDMVKLSRVNMYLHGFPEPHIFEYDTLTSEDRWDDSFDVILANPPFMSPKGGIRPHKRFSVQANRSEVLFVDYIAEHLTSNGRAGVIVPEGIIFQSGTAYKQLRKMLVDDYLYAVVSLPAGVFQPYSGVKTSILFFDPELAKKSPHIIFANINHDGFSLSSQRKQTEQNDLPEAARELRSALKQQMAALREGKVYEPSTGFKLLHFVPKLKIAETGDYNLSGDRYRQDQISGTDKWPKIKFSDESLFRIESGGTPSSSNPDYWGGDIKWATLVDLPPKNLITEIHETERHISDLGVKNSSAKILPAGTVIVSSRATIGRIAINKTDLATNQGFKNIIIKDTSKVIPEYVAYMVTGLVGKMNSLATGGTFKEISKSSFVTLEIPLPPVEVQKAIVTELEGYQKILNAARTIAEDYRPIINADPSWPKLKVGEIFNKVTEQWLPGSADFNFYVGLENIESGTGRLTLKQSEQTNVPVSNKIRFQKEDILYGKLRPNLNKVWQSSLDNSICSTDFLVLRAKDESKVNTTFFTHNFRQADFNIEVLKGISGSQLPRVSPDYFLSLEIPVPPKAIQDSAAEHLKAAENSIRWHADIVKDYEQKIKDIIAEVWS